MTHTSRFVIGMLAATAVGFGGWTLARPHAQAMDSPFVLMPMPASIKATDGRVVIAASSTVALRGFQDDRLRAAVNRAMRRLEGRTGYLMARGFAADPSAATFVVDCQGPGAALPSLDEDESYALN